MSYEYKEKIKEDLEYSLEGVSIDYYSSEELIHKQKVKELDNVYAQAAKADEYEAKAKAFDERLESFKELERLHEEVRKVSKRNQDKAEVYKEVLFHVIREMESNLGESGEHNEL